jgi:hypothetical protein
MARLGPNRGVQNGHIVQLLKEVATTLGLNAANYSTHSIRIGGVSQPCSTVGAPLLSRAVKPVGDEVAGAMAIGLLSVIPRVNIERHRGGFEAHVLASWWSVLRVDDWLGGFPPNQTQERGLA